MPKLPPRPHPDPWWRDPSAIGKELTIVANDDHCKASAFELVIVFIEHRTIDVPSGIMWELVKGAVQPFKALLLSHDRHLDLELKQSARHQQISSARVKIINKFTDFSRWFWPTSLRTSSPASVPMEEGAGELMTKLTSGIINEFGSLHQPNLGPLSIDDRGAKGGDVLPLGKWEDLAAGLARQDLLEHPGEIDGHFLNGDTLNETNAFEFNRLDFELGKFITNAIPPPPPHG